MLRDAFTVIRSEGPKSPAAHRSKYISFHHPGYGDFGDNVLVKLLAPDGERGGITQQFALDACAVLACNRFDGYFTEHGSTQRVIPSDGIIPPGDYDFHVPGEKDDEPYPIGASFFDWQFPHDAIPDRWQEVPSPESLSTSNIPDTTATLAQRDRSCRISAHQELPQKAYVIPKEEQTWFTNNGMRRYTVEEQRHGPELLDNVENMLLLRRDLQMLWDLQSFVFVPKGPQHEMVVHVIRKSEELLELYHNRKTQPLFARHEFLFARFAWTVFPFIRGFLYAGRSRTLSVRGKEGYIVQKFSAAQCAVLADKRSGRDSLERRDSFESDSNTAELPEDLTRSAAKGRPEGSSLLLENWLANLDHPANTRLDNVRPQMSDPAVDRPERCAKRRRGRSDSSFDPAQCGHGLETLERDMDRLERPRGRLRLPPSPK